MKNLKWHSLWLALVALGFSAQALAGDDFGGVKQYTKEETNIARVGDFTHNLHFCGDGHLDDGEDCDDGNEVDTDDCTSECKVLRSPPPVPTPTPTPIPEVPDLDPPNTQVTPPAPGALIFEGSGCTMASAAGGMDLSGILRLVLLGLAPMLFRRVLTHFPKGK